MNAFALGRMRHLELLTLFHQLNPDSHEHHARAIARLSKDNLAAFLLNHPQ